MMLSNTVDVPSFLPKILSEWFEAAIRTRPSDLRRWSEMYFRMKANGESPPVKPYIDVPGEKLAPGGLTPSVLKTLALTLVNEFEPSEKIEKIWDILSLEKKTFLEIIEIGKFNEVIRPTEFIGIAAAHLNTRLRDTMILLCDTFSKPNSDGITLDCFVSVYQYLARLDCADVAAPRDETVVFVLDEKTENAETNAVDDDDDDDDDQCLKSTDSQTSSSDSDRVSSCHSAVKETEDDFPETESARGIMGIIGNSDHIDGAESISNGLNKYTTRPIADAILCDDLDYLLSLKKLNESSSNDLLSLLSGSSVISEPDSCASTTTNDTQPMDELILTTHEQQPDGEEGMSSGRSSVIRDLNYGDFDGSYDDVAVENDEIAVGLEGNEETAYGEDGKNYNDDDDDNNTVVGAVQEYTVMLAVVDYENGPSPEAETDGPRPPAENDSTGSEFSLLDRVELDDNEAGEQRTDGNGPPYRRQTFEDDYYVNFGGESAGSETSTGDGSNETQYSQADRQSVGSVGSSSSSSSGRMSIPSEAGSAYEADDSTTTEGNGSDADREPPSWWADEDGFSTYAGFELWHADEEQGEHNAYVYAYGEADGYSDAGRASDIESAASEHGVLPPPVTGKAYVPVLAGVGPTVPEKQIGRVVDWVTGMAGRQHGYVYGHNLMRFLCPPLDLKPTMCDDGPETIPYVLQEGPNACPQ